ncbi:MAG: DUF1002 domain-containing protein [Bacteroidota bacterium]
MRRILVICLGLILFQAALGATWQRVISYGADLSPEERVSVVRDFALPPEVNPGQIPTVTVEHREEVELLKRVAAPEVIGTKAISSVYVEAAAAGTGLLVSAKNITWVTPGMFANAMATAGVRDARAFVTAPVPVSGTAALAGIFKAFSYLSGRTLSPSAQEAAADELVRTGELGQSLGQDQATEFMSRTKEEVVRSRATSYQEIRVTVERVAREQNLKLTEDQLRKVTDVMIRVSKLDLDLDRLRTQLKNFTVQPGRAATGLSGLIAQIVAFFQSLFKQLVGFVGRAFLRRI